MKILGDQPIRSKNEDILGRLGFAEHITKGILGWKSKGSLCIALYGPWGSGKTSMINLCIESIREKTKKLRLEDRPIIVQFRPWLFSGQEYLIKLFLSQLRTALKAPDLSAYAHKAAAQLEIFEKLFSLASWIPPVGIYAEKIRSVLAKLKRTSQALSKQFEEDLEANKDSISKSLSNLKSPVIIIIDNVDRLSTQEIRQLFQVIKAIADFPNTVYILVFDYFLVEKALEQFQAGGETGYLEKIVQLAFEVPNPSRTTIVEVLWDGLDDIIGTILSEEDEQKRWNEIRFSPLPALFRNVRDVKRYLNAVNFMFPIIEGEVNSLDLLIVEAFHVFAPPLYRAIRNNKEYLVSDSPRAIMDSRNDKEKKEWINKLPELVPERYRNEMKEMLAHLFPEIEAVFKNHGWGEGFLEMWEKNQRVCISSYFEYYFQTTVPEGEISGKEVKRVIDLLEDQNNLTSILENYMADGRIKKLLPKLESYFEDNIDMSRIQNFISSIFESGEAMPLKANGVFELPLDWAIEGTIYRLLKKLDSKVRRNVLVRAIHSSKNAILFPVNVASRIWREWNPISEKESKKADKEKLLSKEEAEEVKDVALGLLREQKDSEILYKARNLLSILYDWERWCGIEEVKEWVENIISDEKKIPEFLGGCGGFHGKTTIGSHYAMYEFKVEPKKLERFCDIKKLKEKCEQLLTSGSEWLTDGHKKMVKAFLEGF